MDSSSSQSAEIYEVASGRVTETASASADTGEGVGIGIIPLVGRAATADARERVRTT